MEPEKVSIITENYIKFIQCSTLCQKVKYLRLQVNLKTALAL